MHILCIMQDKDNPKITSLIKHNKIDIKRGAVAVPALKQLFSGNAVRSIIFLPAMEKHCQDREHSQYYLHDTMQLHCIKLGWNHD